MESLHKREVACSASDQGSNFESSIWRALFISSHSSQYVQEVLLVRFSLYVHKGGLKPQSSHSIFLETMHMLAKSISYNYIINRTFDCFSAIIEHV